MYAGTRNEACLLDIIQNIPLKCLNDSRALFDSRMTLACPCFEVPLDEHPVPSSSRVNHDKTQISYIQEIDIMRQPFINLV